jgi:hypothetical protein
LKADVSEAGEGCSDNQIIDALATRASVVYRVRKQLVEDGLEAVLSGKPRAASSESRPVWIHPQLLSDFFTIEEIAQKMLEELDGSFIS